MSVTLNLDTLVLDRGAHPRRGVCMCLLEAVAWYAGEEHGDAPGCVSPVLRTFGVRLSDALPDDRRQDLKPLIPVLMGTAGDGRDQARSYRALDWLVRVYTPIWLDLAGLDPQAQALAGLAPLVDSSTAFAARPVARMCGQQATAAGVDAGAEFLIAARDAGRDAGRDAAWAAAWDAAPGGASSTARFAMRAAMWATALVAAAAAQTLAPAVEQLQRSAVALFTAMVRP